MRARPSRPRARFLRLRYGRHEMPVGDRESRQAPASADAPDRQIQAPAPTAQLASQIGNRAFAALVARFPG